MNLKENIVLIGMPGCGKTTIGKKLAVKLNIDFCDIDDYIVSIEGKNINDIFHTYGEQYFRNIETNSIREISKQHPKIISTGGGVIKESINIEMLKKNGKIIFLDRPLQDIYNDLDINTRPLLKNGKEKLYKLYEERYFLYKKYYDYKVINKEINVCIREILNYINSIN